jgi:pimeloyl-ACP methyl ester carboxylesterase
VAATAPDNRAMLFATGEMELHYDLTGDGDPLLWLHGHMGHGPDWRYIFPEPPRGYRVIAPDQRGHGRSTGGGRAYSFRQSALEMCALLDALGVDRVKIIGLSGGGITALHMATAQPERVQAMAIVSAPPTFPDQARAIQRMFSEAMLSEQERVLMRERHRRDGQIEALFAQVHAFAEGDDPAFTAAHLAAITADTLIVFGDRDPLYPVSLAVELRQSIPRSWLWVVPNGGHAPVFGAFAPQFVTTVHDFFAGRFVA